MYYESENFSDFSLQHIFLNPKILGFIFSTKNSPAQGVKCEKKNKLQKIVENLLDRLRKLYMSGTAIEK